ncbi:MAG TPA: hypothetical protein PK075_09890, partial [Chitinophagales bacterium]|nr:hypothetical protein [Chitinophagales bacterium]
KESSSQQTLFPRTINLSAGDYQYMEEILPDLRKIGLDIEPFGNNSIIVHGLPPELVNEDEHSLIENILQHYKESLQTDNLSQHQQIAKSVAYHTAIKPSTILDEKSMQNIIDSLFACKQPNINPVGLKTFTTYTIEDIQLLFDK